MSVCVKDNKNEIILENLHTKITVSKKDAVVLSALRTDISESYLSDETSVFITLFKNDEEVEIITALEYSDGIISVVSKLATVRIEVKAFDNYFTFEILDNLPETLSKIEFANIHCNYEVEGDNAWGAVGLAMTVNTHPGYVPRAKQRHVHALAERVTGNTKGAKYALVSAPLDLHRDILKEVCLTIDREKGIVLSTSGPWAKDNPLVYQIYCIVHGTNFEHVNKADEYLARGIQQLDFHHSPQLFLQGNFKTTQLESMKEFKKLFADPLLEKGIISSLHTYAHYIHPLCHDILSVPENQDQLLVLDEYTLSEDISAQEVNIPTVESLADMPYDNGFFSRSLPYIRIGNEFMSFVKKDNRIVVTERGACGTKAVSHKKGERVCRMEGYFNLFEPRCDSPLFIEIAHNTAKAYNEGGFRMIYFDAIDGMGRQTDKKWYYDALFVHEVLRYCDIDPIVEYADHPAGLWASRGRGGAWDNPWTGYKGHNRLHTFYNHKDCDDCHLVGMMGWYNLYPFDDSLPGNYEGRYHHWDDAEFFGSLCLIHGFSGVSARAGLDRYPALKRNYEICKKYYDLKAENYFSEEYLSKLKDYSKEYHLKKKNNGKYIFEEKDFRSARYYDIADTKRNKNKFTNPFKAQTPFVRLEAGLSTLKTEKLILLPLNEDEQIKESVSFSYPAKLNLADHRAVSVRIHGNGKKGSAVRISLISRGIDGGYSNDFVVDTDFTGWREFVFAESQKSERPDLPFDKKYRHFYGIYRTTARLSEISHIRVDSAGDIEGVRMSNIYACPLTFDVIKNPKIKVGKSEVMFECELKSTDFIEFDGKEAKVLDRYGNSKNIYFTGAIRTPRGEFTAELCSAKSYNKAPQNFRLTFGFTGDEIK